MPWPGRRASTTRSARPSATAAGSVVLGGRGVAVRRPRVRSADGTSEIGVPAYEPFASTELLGEIALEAAKQFRRVNGFLHLPALRAALDDHVRTSVTPVCDEAEVAA